MIYRYTHNEWFVGIEEPNLNSKDKIILWGAGKVGSVVAHALNKRGLDFVAFVDSAEDKQGLMYCNHKIISPQELLLHHKDAIIIVSCAYPTVMDEIHKLGLTKAYNPHCLLKEVDFEGYEGELTVEFACRVTEDALRNYVLYYGRGLAVERLYFAITDKCSLNCKNCDGYIPYVQNPKNDSFDSIVESYQRIIKVCEVVDTIDVFGGEPLVHPEIEKIVDFFINDSRCNRVNIISNGTILPSPKLVEILKNNKCLFRISDYGNLSSKKEQLIALFEKENIKYEVTNYQYWDNIPLIQKLNETEEELDAKFAACTANIFYVRHGKLSCCNFVAGLSSLDEVLLPNFEKNYVDLLEGDLNSVFEYIRNYIKQLHDRKHIDACKYCPGSRCIHFEDKQPVAEQVKGKISIEKIFKDGKRICISQT